MSTPSDPGTYTDPLCAIDSKREIQAGERGGKPGQWSARKSQLLAHEYAAQGGGYKKDHKTEAQESLDDWTEQDWRTEDGQPARRGDKTARYLPDAAWKKLTPAQRKETNAKKLSASAEKQFVDNTQAAQKARRQTTEHKE